MGLVLGSSLPPQVWAQTESFDPSVCATDTGGKVIVRLVSGLAFAIEPEGFLPRFPVTDPAAPPGVPRGCPESPIVTEGLALPFAYNAALADRADLPFGHLSMLQLFGHDGPVTVQRNTLGRYETLREATGFCGVADNGLRYCHACDEDPERPGYCQTRADGSNNFGQLGWDWYTALVGPPREGIGAEALPIAIYCLERVLFVAPDCTVQYKVREGLSVVYDVTTAGVPGEVLPDLLLGSDRLVRDFIEARRAPAHDGPDLRAFVGLGSSR